MSDIILLFVIFHRVGTLNADHHLQILVKFGAQSSGHPYGRRSKIDLKGLRIALSESVPKTMQKVLLKVQDHFRMRTCWEQTVR